MPKGEDNPQPLKRSYKELKESLDNKIAVMQQKIDIINELRDSKQTADFAQSIILTEHVGILEDEICLILEAKSNASWTKHGKNYQPVLVGDWIKASSLQEVVKKNVTDKQSFHYDLISLSTRRHCTPLQIDFDGKKIIAVAHGAARNADNDFRIKVLMIWLKEEFDSTNLGTKLTHLYESHPAIQNDSSSCAIFSLQDLNSMNKIGISNLSNYFHDYNKFLQEEKNYKPLSCEISSYQISKLHPRFVKNGQSKTVIDMNLSKPENKLVIVSKTENLEQYVENYSVPVMMLGKNNIVKLQNRAIDCKMWKYLKAARATLEEIYKLGGDELLLEIIEQRMGKIIFDPESVIKTREAYGLVNSLQLDSDTYKAEDCKINSHTFEQNINLQYLLLDLETVSVIGDME